MRRSKTPPDPAARLLRLLSNKVAKVLPFVSREEAELREIEALPNEELQERLRKEGLDPDAVRQRYENLMKQIRRHSRRNPRDPT